MAELSSVSELVETERVVSAFGFIPNVSTDTFSLIVRLVMRRRYQCVVVTHGSIDLSCQWSTGMY